MDRLIIQNKNIEQLASLGYWEWWPKQNTARFSEGVNTILSFISQEITTKAIIKYIKATHLKVDYLELLKYIHLVKKGNPPASKIFSFQMADKRIRHFELNCYLTYDKQMPYIAGTIQEVTDKVKYNILKEKELLFERKISEIASRFVNSDDYENAMLSTMSEVGELCQAGLVYLLRIDNNSVSEEFRLGDHSNKPFINLLAPKEVNYLIEVIKEQKLVYYHNLDETPPFINGIKNILQEQQASSLAIAGIQNDRQTIGALVLIRFEMNQKWDFSDIHILKMTSLIISNTIKQHVTFKRLKQSEKRLQFALLAGNLGTWEYDLREQKYYVDERYANIFGYSNNTINRIPGWLKDNLHPADIANYFSTLESCLEGEQNFYALEYRVKAKNGSYKWINDWSIVTKVDNNGEPVVMVGIIQDISQKKQVEEELIKAKEKAEENDKLKTAFLANVSHEIRTPMNGITGFAELLYNNTVSDTEKHQYLEIIYKSSNQLLSLLNNIIDISKLETRQLQLFNREVSINELLEDIERHFAPTFAKNPLLELRIIPFTDKLLTYINADESRLKQVLINLIDNALNFTQKGFVELGYSIENNQHIEFYVKDTGDGIPVEYQKHIFDRFVQSNPAISINTGGTGLGLPISRGLVELMGGKIWIKSYQGMGSSIYFTIPYQPTRLKLEHMD
jgi:PAS domain S-box-containing protein